MLRVRAREEPSYQARAARHRTHPDGQWPARLLRPPSGHARERSSRSRARQLPLTTWRKRTNRARRADARRDRSRCRRRQRLGQEVPTRLGQPAVQIEHLPQETGRAVHTNQLGRDQGGGQLPRPNRASHRGHGDYLRASLTLVVVVPYLVNNHKHSTSDLKTSAPCTCS